jgi:hypothetical protein
MEANRRSRRKFGLPPTPDDLLVEQLTRNDPYFNPPNRKQNGYKPKPAEKSHPEAKTPNSEKAPESNNVVNDSIAVPSPWGEGQGEGGLNSKLNPENSTLPPNPSTSYEGKTNHQIISEIEEKHLREKAARLNPSRRTGVPPVSDSSNTTAEMGAHAPRVPCSAPSPDTSSPPPASEKGSETNNNSNRPTASPSPNPSPAGAGEGGRRPGEGSQGKSEYCGEGRGEGGLNPKPKPQNSTLPKPPLNDYDRALLAGKTFLEALYAQSARPKPGSQPAAQPPGSSPWDTFSQKVDVYSGFRSAPSINFRSALGRNTLG